MHALRGQSRPHSNIRHLRREILEDRRVLSSVSFSAMQLIDQAEGPNEPTVVKAYDLDGDGNQDVLAGFADGTVGWFRNEGNGEISGMTRIGKNGLSVFALSVNDMDRDGDGDILATLNQGSHIVTYENRGDASFAAFRQTRISSTTEVQLADLNGEGDVEAVTIGVFHTVGENDFHTMFIHSSSFDSELFEFQTRLQSIETEFHFPRNTRPRVAHAVTDLDGNGTPDVIVGSPELGKIAWFSNLGDGLLSESGHDIDVDGFPRLLATDDVDGDGDQDLIAYHESQQIVWFENDLEQRFTTALTIDLPFQLDSLETVDFDMDGHVDLLTSTDSEIVWLRNDGRGRFGEPRSLSTNRSRLASFAYADFDNDGDLDIAYADQTNDTITWSEFDDAGGVTNEHILLRKHLDHPEKVVAADFDGDLDLDILYASKHQNVLRWYANDGNSQYQSRPSIDMGQQLVTSVVAADFDADQDIDLISSSSTGELSFHENDGAGNFNTSTVLTEMSPDTELFAVDLDNDGDSDVIARQENDIVWFLNDGEIDFSVDQTIVTESQRITSFSVGDLDGDGDLDVVYALPRENSIVWSENQGDEFFGPSDLLISSVDHPVFLRLADLDDDGALDILTSSPDRWDGRLFWFDNADSFEIRPLPETEQLGFPHDVAIDDWDGDGDMDIISVSDTAMIWHENPGDGRFRSHHVATRINDFASPTVADVNGDGISDIVVGLRNTDSLGWYQIQFSNQWTGPIPIQLDGPNQISASFTADLDNDGDIDIVTTSYGDGALSWYENLSDGGFDAEKLIFRNLGRLDHVTGGDFDQDGDIDLVSASGDSGTLVWHENLDQARFIQRQTLKTQAFEPQVVDLDRDGDVDVLTHRGWFSNDGNGYFEARSLPQPGYFDHIHPADIDGDADVDLVASISRSDRQHLVWLENIGGFSFGDEHLIRDLSSLRSVVVTDQDADGDIDVIWNDRTRLNLVLNDGAGRFIERHRIGSSSSYDLISVDVNDDGLLDVLAQTGASWYENLGELDFERHETNSGMRLLNAVDIDNDGTSEFIAGTSDTLVVVNRIGSRGFSTTEIDGGPVGALHATLVDIDNDSDLDAIVSQQDGPLVWHENDGLGNFRPAQDIAGVDDYAARQIADFNDDGLSDVIWTDRTRFGYEILLGFQGEHRQFLPSVEVATSERELILNVSDLDQDGDIDIVFAESGEEWAIRWLENMGHGAFVMHDIGILTGVSHHRYEHTIHIADLDTDGRLDVFTSQSLGSGEYGPLQWYRNRGDMVFEDPVELGASRPILIADIDGDTFVDLFTSEQKWYEYDGRRGLTATHRMKAEIEQTVVISSERDIYSRPSYVEAAGLSDIDEDGDLDLLISANTARWYINNGEGYFDRLEPFASTIGSPNSFAIGDIDGDGDDDIFYAKDDRSPTEIGAGWVRNETVSSQPGDFNNDKSIDSKDIDLFCQTVRSPHENAQMDLNEDNRVDHVDFDRLVFVLLESTPGDANLDGEFNAQDMMLALQSGTYEDSTRRNSTWSTGDWNCDGEFDSADLVAAFQWSSSSANLKRNEIAMAVAGYLDDSELSQIADSERPLRALNIRFREL